MFNLDSRNNSLFSFEASVDYWGKWNRNGQALIHNGENVTFGELVSYVSCVQHCVRKNGIELTNINKFVAVSDSPIAVVILWLVARRFGWNVDIGNSQVKTHSCQQFKLSSTDSQTLRAEVSFSYIDALHLYEDEFKRNSSDDFSPWGMFSTSGSQGTPKTVVRSKASVNSEIHSWIRELQLSPSETVGIFNPVSYTGSAVLIFATLSSGASVKFVYQNDVSGCTVLILTPPKFRELDSLDLYTQSDVKKILLSGEPIDTWTLKRALYHCNYVLASWGNTEGLGLLSGPFSSSDHVSEVQYRPFLCESVGIDTSNIPSLHDVGVIFGCVDTPSLNYSIVGSRVDEDVCGEQTCELTSEDLGCFLESGYVKVLGRFVDLGIIRNIYPMCIAEFEYELRIILNSEVVALADNAETITLLLESELGSESRQKLEVYLGSKNLKLGDCLIFEKIPENRNGKRIRFLDRSNLI